MNKEWTNNSIYAHRICIHTHIIPSPYRVCSKQVCVKSCESKLG